MRPHAIIEIEEGALTLTFGVRIGGRVHVTRCLRTPLADLGRDSLAEALRPLANDHLQDSDGVHVILGERRVQHFVSALPKLPATEVADFAVREALRVTSMPGAGEVLVAPRLVRRAKGGKLVIGVTALPRNVWEPLREAFKQCNLRVSSLHSTEACLAAGAFAALRSLRLVKSEATAIERSAVVECGAGRARFVLCDGKSAVQVRRFMVGAAEANGDALAAQLAMELPRTIDWLRETGHQLPGVLVLGHRVALGDEAAEGLRGDLARVVRAPSIEVTGDATPSLASTTLLQQLADRDGLPSLLDPPRVRLPVPGWRRLLLPAAAAAGGLFSLYAVHERRATYALRDQIADTMAERETIRQQLVAADVVIRAPFETGAQVQQLNAALGLRRPISRLLAEVSNAANDQVRLDGLQFASNERVVLTGVVRDVTRTGALAQLAEFADRVRALPYLEPYGQEDVGEVLGQPSQFRFRLGMAWRDS